MKSQTVTHLMAPIFPHLIPGQYDFIFYIAKEANGYFMQGNSRKLSKEWLKNREESGHVVKLKKPFKIKEGQMIVFTRNNVPRPNMKESSAGFIRSLELFLLSREDNYDFSKKKKLGKWKDLVAVKASIK